MVAFLLLAVLFIVLAVAGMAGWCVDSRDSRFSLWPLHRGDPNDRPGVMRTAHRTRPAAAARSTSRGWRHPARASRKPRGRATTQVSRPRKADQS
jgi:hypothetical protein